MAPNKFGLILLAALLLTTTNSFADVLDKTSWAVVATPTRQTAASGAKSFPDVLTFSAGKVLSATLKKSGIGAVTYSVHGANGFYNWETVPVSNRANAAEWGGVINGKNMSGHLTRCGRDGRILYYNIEGRER